MDALRFGVREERLQEGLSFAALQTIAASLGGSTYCASRADDAGGIDAICSFRGRWFGGSAAFQQLEVHFQLKATRRKPSTSFRNGTECWSFPLGVDQLARYVEPRRTPLVLVLFIFPSDSPCWVESSEKGVFIIGSLYWTPLAGFPLDVSKTSNIVYVPKSSLLTPESLAERIIKPLAEERRLVYGQ